MKLITKELEERFKNYPLYSQESKGFDATVVVKYFNPFGSGTWLITEGERQPDGNWLLFGYCNIHVWEWGYVLLSELESVRIIERDLFIPKKQTVRDFLAKVK